MKKIIGILKLVLISSFFIGCNAYQLSSYYGDSDGIYVSNERGIDYEVVFSEYADESLNTFSSNENNSRNLPWGANPQTTEVVNNFFPSFGRFYYDPFYHNMAFNPFFTNNGMFINYGFRPPFFYNSFAYEMGYPFYGPLNFYFSPYATSLGNYYWYMMRNRRYAPWYYGGMYDSTVYRDEYGNEISNTSRVSFSNSASRRGERNSSNGVSRKSDSQGVKVSGIYSRLGSYGGALVGSFYSILICLLLAFPVAVLASIYLEEFAPKNKITDFIEININNLAAVPSIVYGLLALQILLATIQLPRSTPLVAGITLALMTSPLSSMASLGSVVEKITMLSSDRPCEKIFLNSSLNCSLNL